MTSSKRTRFAIALTPLLAVLACLFAAQQFYWSFRAFRAGNIPFAGIYCLMAIGGFALGIALWRTRRKFRPPAD